MSKFVRLAFAMLFLIALSSCASVSVDKVTRLLGRPAEPQRILVQEFDLPLAAMRVDRGGESLQKFRQAFVRQLAVAIAERAGKNLGVPAARSNGAPTRSEAAWLVTGKFLTVHQGSRALRAIVGLGAGRTRVETVVTVWDLSTVPPQPFLKFVTTGGSNSQPGAAFGLIMPNYWLLAADVAGKIAPGLNADVIRTSRELVAVLSEYMAQAGYLREEKVFRAKRLGKWP